MNNFQSIRIIPPPSHLDQLTERKNGYAKKKTLEQRGNGNGWRKKREERRENSGVLKKRLKENGAPRHSLKKQRRTNWTQTRARQLRSKLVPVTPHIGKSDRRPSR